jgi:hypothetical protein
MATALVDDMKFAKGVKNKVYQQQTLRERTLLPHNAHAIEVWHWIP